jgi:hypothetical protein
MKRVTKTLSVFMIICVLVPTGSAAFAGEKGKANAKGKQKIEAKENHGREAGELPYGLTRRTTNKGELPSGLQKKDELPRGLEEGGKSAKSASKAKKVSNK